MGQCERIPSMISVTNLSLSFGQQVLFKDVNIKFTPGNCYGVIGANGSGKSTLLKVLAGELMPDTGQVAVGRGERIAVLRQDQFLFDEHSVLDTVIMGHHKLHEVMTERRQLYAKADFSDEDGMRVADLESEFSEMGGWEAEAEAGRLLSGLGLPDALTNTRMGELEAGHKVRVLLAQALFGSPEILLLDEPTNNLDLEAVTWLEEFLYQFRNTAIVVSHDRHFLNRVCTHVADVDYGTVTLFVGNYDFWYHANQLARKQAREEKKRREDKIAELQAFIQRFSSNAARSRQATSRQKLVEKLSIDDLKPSRRRAPYVSFSPLRETGRKVLDVEGLRIRVDGEELLKDFSVSIQPGDKVALVGPRHAAKSALLQVLGGGLEPAAGRCQWGGTVTVSYFPKDSSTYFASQLTLLEWLQQYTEVDDESYVRGFLGRMLFSGDEASKKVNVLSGGERVRCMLAKMMLARGNVLILDEPTNHLDLEAITAVNDALIDFTGTVLFISHDHQFVDSVANRIIELTPAGFIDRAMRFDDYLASEAVRELRDRQFHGHHTVEI
jgi:ATPase subunit of ABC transporter with duplicated ATPase domains